jgi:hypothetical protein
VRLPRSPKAVAVVAVATLLTIRVPTAQASGHLPSFDPCGAEAAAVWLGLLFPSDAGVFIPASGGPEFEFGWSWQVPISLSCNARFTGSVELIPSDANVVRGRFGYRYARRYFLVGFGGSFSGDGNTWSPEVGVQFAHWRLEGFDRRYNKTDQYANVAHLLARTEFNSRFRGVTILLGWNVF